MSSSGWVGAIYQEDSNINLACQSIIVFLFSSSNEVMDMIDLKQYFLHMEFLESSRTMKVARLT